MIFRRKAASGVVGLQFPGFRGLRVEAWVTSVKDKLDTQHIEIKNDSALASVDVEATSVLDLEIVAGRSYDHADYGEISKNGIQWRLRRNLGEDVFEVSHVGELAPDNVHSGATTISGMAASGSAVKRKHPARQPTILNWSNQL